jgi:hypothetical protein
VSYLPVFCDVCSAAFLVEAASETRASCPSCREPVRIIPGPAYDASNRPLFEKIEQAVRAASPSRPDCLVLAEDLERLALGTEQPGPVLEGLSVRLPGLASVAGALDAPHQARLAVVMLRTVISPRSREPLLVGSAPRELA